MQLNRLITTVVALGLSATTSLTACARSGDSLTLKEARSLAMQHIKQEQNFWCYNANRLPPLQGEESPNQYVFTVNDRKQNVSITVSVTKKGEIEESAVDLDLEKAWESGQNVTLGRTKTHCAENGK